MKRWYWYLLHMGQSTLLARGACRFTVPKRQTKSPTRRPAACAFEGRRGTTQIPLRGILLNTVAALKCTHNKFASGNGVCDPVKVEQSLAARPPREILRSLRRSRPSTIAAITNQERNTHREARNLCARVPAPVDAYMQPKHKGSGQLHLDQDIPRIAAGKSKR